MTAHWEVSVKIKHYLDKIVIFVFVIIFVVVGYLNKDTFLSKEENHQKSQFGDQKHKNRKNDKNFEEKKEDNKISDSKILVHITGHVKNPGVYELQEGARLNDLIKLCGGLLDNYDENINLAIILRDEMKIHIYEKGEEKNPEISKRVDSDKVDINSAKKEELMSIPGIGEKKADDIIEYRKTQKFKKIEDLTNVKGIGQKTLNKIRDKLEVRWLKITQLFDIIEPMLRLQEWKERSWKLY